MNTPLVTDLAGNPVPVNIPDFMLAAFEQFRTNLETTSSISVGSRVPMPAFIRWFENKIDIMNDARRENMRLWEK